MNKPEPALVAMLHVEGNRNGEKQRTLKDLLLTSAWVAGYAGVVIVFRFTSAMENLFSSKQKEVHAAETSVAAWDRADLPPMKNRTQAATKDRHEAAKV
jgi:hypothetical protein